MTDPLPSDEAVEAAWREAHEASRDYIAQPTVRAALTAAYAIDMPRREAEVRPFVDHARTAHAAAQTTYGNTCHWCGHKHDPEDGRCDAHAHVGLGRCPCPGEGLAVAYDKINAALYVAEQDCAELRGRLEAAPEPEWEYRAIRGHTYSGAWPSEAKARYHGALSFGPDAPFTIERRRKAGEWEALPDAD